MHLCLSKVGVQVRLQELCSEMRARPILACTYAGQLSKLTRGGLRDDQVLAS